MLDFPPLFVQQLLFGIRSSLSLNLSLAVRVHFNPAHFHYSLSLLKLVFLFGPLAFSPMAFYINSIHDLIQRFYGYMELNYGICFGRACFTSV